MHRKTRNLFLILTALITTSCSQSNQDALTQESIAELSSPSFSLVGTGVKQNAIANYVFASSTGAVTTTTNLVVASFADSFLPLTLKSTSAYSAQMTSGSCTLNSLTATVTADNQISTQISATACTDLAVIKLAMDTTQVVDQRQLSGLLVASYPLTVDLAPSVTTTPRGNSVADGTGTTEGSAGYMSIAVDKSIIVTFSKSLVGGKLTAVLSGCTGTLGIPKIVAGTSGHTVAWPLTAFTGAAGSTCSFSVAAVADYLGNLEDPADTHLTTTLTFHP